MKTPISAPPAPDRAPGTADRAPAPDLARGIMLLAIAFAHAPLFVTAVDRGSALANDLANAFNLLFVTNHARPMFAFLFGYGMVQLLHRQTERGADRVTIRKLLRRRGWWLVAIGFLHTALLVPIDILAAYGLAAVLLAGLPWRKDTTLLWAAGITLVPATLVAGAAMWYFMTLGDPSLLQVLVGTHGPWELIGDRLAGLPFGLAVGTLMVVPGAIAGMWAARRRVLDEPERHRRLLARTAVVTTVLSAAGALPLGLIQIGAWARPSAVALWVAALAQPLTGYLGGIGLAAIIALIAIRAGRRRNRLATAVEALGRRSMSLYLFQSIAFIAAFAPYGLGLQDDLGLAGAMGVGLATWLISLLLAELMRRTGYRGPAEILLRRLAYRRPRSQP